MACGGLSVRQWRTLQRAGVDFRATCKISQTDCSAKHLPGHDHHSCETIATGVFVGRTPRSAADAHVRLPPNLPSRDRHRYRATKVTVTEPRPSPLPSHGRQGVVRFPNSASTSKVCATGRHGEAAAGHGPAPHWAFINLGGPPGHAQVISPGTNRDARSG
jgi:hypothetical protein